MDSSQLPTHVIDGQVCKSTPVLYIACVKHRLALICEKEDINTEDEACPQKMADIRNCNPLVMRNNGYPMLRAHRMRKNRQKNYKPIEGPTTPMKVVTKSGKKQTTRRGRSG